MRLILFFDLPTLTHYERKEYRRFRKFLLKNGFIMLQFSVYSKLLLNNTAETLLKDKIRINKPEEGSIFMLTITEKQFGKMELVSGERQSLIIDTDERLIVL